MDNEIATGGDTAENVDAQLEQMRQEEANTPEVTNEAPEAPEQTQERAPEQKQVPLAALHEERQARRQLKQELEQLRQERAADMQRFEQRLQQLVNPPKPPPARDEDPVGYMDERLNQVTQTNQQLLQTIQQERQERQAVQQLQQLAGSVQEREKQFIAQTPDYYDAVKHLARSRVEELMVFGATEEQAIEQEANERLQFAFTQLQNGRNPAELAYNLAKKRGYTGQASVTDKIQTQQRGMAGSRSLGSGGGVSNGLSAEALLKMSDEEFDKLSPAQWKKAWGG